MYTSKQVLEAFDSGSMYDITAQVSESGIPIKYQMTYGELGWLDFVRGRYSIADWIDDRLELDVDDSHVLTIDDSESLSRALDDDCGGAAKALCLSDDTALQALFFYLYSESL